MRQILIQVKPDTYLLFISYKFFVLGMLGTIVATVARQVSLIKFLFLCLARFLCTEQLRRTDLGTGLRA